MFEDEAMDFEAYELLNNLSCVQKTLSSWTTLSPHEQLVYNHPTSTMISAMVPKTTIEFVYKVSDWSIN